MKKRILLPIVLLLTIILSLTACDGFQFGKQIESLAITGGAPTEVLVGETPDFSQIKLLATYNDLSTVELGVDDVEISAVDTSKPQKVEYTITYDGLSITASLEVKVPSAPKPGDTTPVAPTLTSLAYRSGLKSSIYKNDVYDTSALTITATYSDDSTKIVEAKDLKFLTEIDPKKVGEQTLKVAYESLTLEFTVTVMEILPVGIEVDPESVDTTVAEGYNPDISGLKVYLCYNNGDRHLIASNDSKLVANNFPPHSAGNRNWVITYGEFSTTVILSSTPPVVTGITVNSGYATWVLLGETYNAGEISATATLSNNLPRTVTDLTLSAVDTTTAGKKTVTATYTCADGTFSSTFEIEVVTVVSVAIDTGSFEAHTTLGKFDVSNLRVDLTLSNGEFIERAVKDGVVVNGADFDKNSVYEGEITATFQGVTSAAVKVTIVAEDFNYVVGGVSDPGQLANWKQNTYQNNFLDSGYGYVVGSNNPFKYTLNLKLLDPTTYLPVEKYVGYTSKSEVLLNGTPVGSEYVTIDEENHTFQFTKAAEGKTFVIKTRPDNIPDSKIETFTKTLEVTVVDAYNIHDAKELNVITNKSIDLGNSGYNQLTVVNTFLQNNGITRPATLNGVVLHNNFTIQKTDLPAEYFCTGVNGNTYIWDHQSIYYHEMTSAGTFNFYGNYFTINTYNIPIVAPQGTQLVGGKVANDDDGYSSSEIFRFNVSNTLWTSNFNHVDYVVNVYALGMNDNDESVSVEDLVESQRHMLGVYAFKLAKATYNFNAVNATRYYITAMAEYDCVTLNLNYTKFYDAWQSHINTWTANLINEDDPENIHANHAPATININNSFVAKAGGPAIFCMNDSPAEPWNRQSKSVVNIDDNSEVFSYVVGNEAWFTSHGISSQAMEIGGIDYFFGLNGVSYKTQLGENSNGFMNMIMITMDANYIPGLSSGAPTDVDGTCTIGGNTVLDMNDYDLTGDGVADITYGNQYVYGTIAQAAAAGAFPPVFASSNGGVGYYDGTALTSLTGNNLYQGDYLTLYYYNLGIVLGFNEGTLPAEPTPPATPWNTAARAY